MTRFATPAAEINTAHWQRSTLACAAFASCALAIALLPAAGPAGGGVHAGLAVYALSFWHYYLYALAWRYGRVPLAVFRRDAVLMKSLALMALGAAYFAAPLDWASLAVVAAGFALNAAAARALGPDGTYYGQELSALPYRRITTFPYGWVSHPMLLGNVAAHAGTLLNAEFRAQWWPLAALHVALNLGLLAMETRVTPLRGRRKPASDGPAERASAASSTGGLPASLAAGSLAGTVGAAWLAGGAATLPTIAVGALAGMHAVVIFHWYASPAAGRHSREQHEHGERS